MLANHVVAHSLVALLVVHSVLASTLLGAGDHPEVDCEALPCRCCKMDCWYAVAKSATHELGHVPGQAGEQEALATLKLIRACMIQECSGVCTMHARPPPFIGQPVV